jgi:hypothetical protein
MDSYVTNPNYKSPAYQLLIAQGANCKYIGNNCDDLGRDTYFAVTNSKTLPPRQEKCLCGVDIIHQHYVQDRTTKEIHVIGSTCINSFCQGKYGKRTCPGCEESTHRSRSIFCTSCKNKNLHTRNLQIDLSNKTKTSGLVSAADFITAQPKNTYNCQLCNVECPKWLENTNTFDVVCINCDIELFSRHIGSEYYKLKGYKITKYSTLTGRPVVNTFPTFNSTHVEKTTTSTPETKDKCINCNRAKPFNNNILCTICLKTSSNGY